MLEDDARHPAEVAIEKFDYLLWREVFDERGKTSDIAHHERHALEISA